LQPQIKKRGTLKGAKNKRRNARLKTSQRYTRGKTEEGRGAVKTGERWGEEAFFKDGSLQDPHRITLRNGEQVGDGTKTQKHHLTRKGNMGDKTKINNVLIWGHRKSMRRAMNREKKP
jgi:hypothetical protein